MTRERIFVDSSFSCQNVCISKMKNLLDFRVSTFKTYVSKMLINCNLTKNCPIIKISSVLCFKKKFSFFLPIEDDIIFYYNNISSFLLILCYLSHFFLILLVCLFLFICQNLSEPAVNSKWKKLMSIKFDSPPCLFVSISYRF